MKSIIISMFLIWNISVPDILNKENEIDILKNITQYRSYLYENGLLPISSSEKIVKLSSSIIHSSCEYVLIFKDFIESFVSTIKINKLLMTIKYESTLFSPAYYFTLK